MSAVKASVANTSRKGRVPHIEAARIGAERGHHQPLAIGREAAAADHPPALRNARHWMQVARHLAVSRCRLMPKRQRADGKRRGKGAADTAGGFGVVVAGNPEPVAPTLQRRERGAVGVGEAIRPFAVMEAVAERDDAARRVAHNEAFQPRQGRRRVIGRQQDAASGQARTFLKVEIGDDQQVLLGPVGRAGGIGDERHTGQHYRRHIQLAKG